MALSNISQFSTAINTPVTTSMTGAITSGGAAQSAGYIYGSAAEAGAEMVINDYGVANAFRVVEGGVGADGVASTATEVLQFSPVVDAGGNVTGANIVKMPATTTEAGTVKAGALSGQVPVGTVLGGIAIGAGIGLKEAASHRQFWNDLVTIGDGINSPEQTISVIWRMMEDGSIQSYCDKRSVDTLIHNLYLMDAFNVIDKIDPTYHGTGEQNIDISGLTSGYIYTAASAVSLGVQAEVVEALYSTGRSRYPAANVILAGAEKYSAGTGTISAVFYNLPAQEYNVVQNADGDYQIANVRDYVVGAVWCSIDVDGSIYGNINHRDYSSSSDNWLNLAQSSIHDLGSGTHSTTASNAGGIYMPKNPNTSYNGTDLLPPEDEADFWDTFSEWLSNGFEQPGYNPLNNSIVPTTWIPFTMPNINWQIDPATGAQTQSWTGIYDFPDAFTDPAVDPAPVPEVDPWIWKTIGDYVVPHIDIPYPTPTPFDDSPSVDPVKPSPTGSTPVITTPTSGLSSALYSVYNPTQSQVNALGSYLWTENIIEVIQQFFQNPLDAIISLHLIYCTPSTSGTKNIKLGYLDSGVSASIVNSQYVTIACGDVSVPEVYHNALDYDDVDIQIYLPFIGFRALNTKEVMGGTVRVTYDVDVYTGICLAKIYVVRPGVSQLLYTFEGNCAIDIPLTSADRSRLVSGLITAGVSAVTGNPAGVVGGLGSVHASIERSGSFSGNAGAMGVKKPYIVIKRAISAQASNYAKQYGYPLNKSGRLAEFKGFTRCEHVHVDIPTATDDEILEIQSMLTEGIII